MRLAETDTPVPDELVMTPAMMAVVRQLARFDDGYVAALARRIEVRAQKRPHLLRHPPRSDDGDGAA